jgi:hypothetical protein
MTSAELLVRLGLAANAATTSWQVAPAYSCGQYASKDCVVGNCAVSTIPLGVTDALTTGRTADASQTPICGSGDGLGVGDGDAAGDGLGLLHRSQTNSQ